MESRAKGRKMSKHYNTSSIRGGAVRKQNKEKEKETHESTEILGF